MVQEVGHIKNIYYICSCFIFRYIQCLHLVNSEITWVLVSSDKSSSAAYNTRTRVL